VSKEKPTLSRRQFMTYFPAAVVTLTGVDAYLAHITGSNTPLTPFWEYLENGASVIPTAPEVERKFGIAIVNPNTPISVRNPVIATMVGQKVADSLVNKNPEGFISPWEPPRIALLATVLHALPNSFYRSDSGPLNCILWNSTDMSRRQIGQADSFRGYCACNQNKTIDNHPPAVVFVKRDLRALHPIDYRQSLQLIVHELTHYLTLARVNFRNSRNITIDAAMATINLPPPSLINLPDLNLIKVFQQHVDIVPGIEGRGTLVYPRESDQLGTSITPQEFIANAATAYFMGKQFFIDQFLADLGSFSTKKLYQFAKSALFENREYLFGQPLA
jgi:hypothetical protein